MNSILTSIKKMLGISEEDTNFDMDIIPHINSALMVLRQLGIGPVEGFSIKDKTAEWDDLVGDNKLYDTVVSYVYLKVKLIFDPPPSTAAIEAIKESISEFESRLRDAAELENK